MSLGQTLARGAVGSLGLQIASTAMALVTAVVLARLLGASDYGHYSLAMIYANLFGLVACLGFPQLFVRHIARFSHEKNWSAIAGLVRTGLASTATAAVVIAVAAAMLVPVVIPDAAPETRLTYGLAMLLVVPIALQRLGETSLLGFDRAVDSQLPERLMRPLAFLALVAAAAMLFGAALGAHGAVLAHVAAYVVSLAGVAILVKRNTPHGWWQAKGVMEPAYLRQSLPLLATGLMTLLSTRLDVMMLGWLSDAEAAGHYRFASQLAVLPLMIATTVQAIVSPSISRYHSEHRLHELKPLLAKLALGAGCAAIAVSIAVVAFFSALLPVIGSSFADARDPLVILLVAYGMMAVMYSGLPLLTMTGHAVDVAWANAWAIACNVILNILLIPRFGASGTAFATLASFAVLYALHHRNVRRLGLLDASAPHP